MKSWVLVLVVLVGFGEVAVGQDSINPANENGLVLWWRADSLGKSFSNNGAIDTSWNWGSLGNVLRQTNLFSRPRYQTGISPTNLPGVYFDGSNDFLIYNGAVADFTSLHDGTGHTIIIAFMTELADRRHGLLATSNSSGTKIGRSVWVETDNRFYSEIRKSSSLVNIYYPSKGGHAGNTGTMQFLGILHGDDGFDDIQIFNAIQDTGQNAVNLPYSTDVPASAFAVGRAFPNGGLNAFFRGWLFEVVIYFERKSDEVVAGLFKYMEDKWRGDSLLAAPANIIASEITQVSARITWDAVPGADGYRVFRRGERYWGDPVAVHSLYHDTVDTSFVDSVFPVLNYDYYVRAYAGSGQGYQTDTLGIESLSYPFTQGNYLKLENYFGQKWADTTFHSFEALPGVGAQQVRRRGAARARAGQQ